MSSLFELQVSERDSTLNPRQLRSAGFLPITIYGSDFPSQNAQLRTHEFSRALFHGNQQFKLVGGGFDGLEVKLQALQKTPVEQTFLNAEFLTLSTVSKKADRQKSVEAATKKAVKAADAAKSEQKTEKEAETALASA